MKYFLTSLTVVVLANSLISCEGFGCAAGRVIDKNTNSSLDSVYCETLTGIKNMYTDSSGKFKLCNQMGGCMPKCADIIIRLSKAGYKTVTLKNPIDSLFYMKRN
jgi:hypothetical protein